MLPNTGPGLKKSLKESIWHLPIGIWSRKTPERLEKKLFSGCFAWQNFFSTDFRQVEQKWKRLLIRRQKKRQMPNAFF